MSNDLSANMRRAELEHASEDRRWGWKALEGQVRVVRDNFYNTLREDLDIFAFRNGWSRQQMEMFAVKRLGLHDFAIFYREKSTAYDDGSAWFDGRN